MCNITSTMNLDELTVENQQLKQYIKKLERIIEQQAKQIAELKNN